MIRLRTLTLDDAKNTRHGVLDFKDLGSGSSVTGIYGQNGSGKTTVIIALQILKILMSGESVNRDGVGFIRQAASQATIKAGFEIDGDLVDYTVSFEPNSDNGSMRVVNERIELATGTQRKRVLIDHGVDHAEDELGYRDWRTTPSVQWRSLRSVKSTDGILQQEETLAWSEGRSFIFSPRVRQTLHKVEELIGKQEHVSTSRTNALTQNLTPLIGKTDMLAGYTRDCMRIVSTRDVSSVSFDYAPIQVTGQHMAPLDISHPVIMPAEARKYVERMVEQADLIMPVLVPGIHIRCDVKDMTMADGNPGVEVFLRSERNGVSIPLWAESEGIRRIMGILSLLVRMFNEENVLVAIDEIDSGIFEILLGDLLNILARRGVGQLVFTAHNLRILEMLSAKSVVFSTANPERRFITVNKHGTNNLRDMYIRLVCTGDGDERMADRVDLGDVANAFYEAGNPEEGEA
ncbi:AAA family ATPase [Bifidobacterium callitrichidarum]|uniref:ATPase AAA-type core domain-containing protein n=1 Tax=Bifidobacterium callitrichidarum TaxID=2052941 RepID=A0A2U2NCF9_9BIFI|nr:AAA family ATPase [Bifidobacterium callitrichidarum]PWG66770.1 hypothetical protein DF196_02385 [Bifidobacterium callitrichidarum]